MTLMHTLLLASTSTTRQRLLANAGLDFRAVASGVDERPLKQQAWAGGLSADAAALLLATAKAAAVSARFPGALVIGADQLLVCNGQWYDKPDTMADARQQLRDLSGKTQVLVTAAVVMRAGETLWKTVDKPGITLAFLDENQIDEYLLKTGDNILSSVGAVQVESIGIQLVHAIDGDFFSILGIPLLPLLKALEPFME